MFEEIVNEVSAKTGLSPEQAQAAVTAVLGFLQSRLPAPISGMLAGVVNGGQPAASGTEGGMESLLEGKGMAALGGLFGSKS